MADLNHPRLIHLKGVLFLCLGLMSGTLLVLACPRAQTVMLLAVSVWAFARFYYYAFYVIERYVDPSYRFSGLASLLRYWMKSSRR
jgi:hypothetical protein